MCFGTSFFVLFLQLLFSGAVLAQQGDDSRSTAFCDFTDGQEVSVRYSNAPISSKDEPRSGKVWTPNGVPMTLFSATTLVLAKSEIPPGAYSVYVIPNRKDWTFIVNKNVTAGAAYDEKNDIARGSMELGEVDSPPKQLQVSFAHTSPKVCSIRLYYGKEGAFIDLGEK